MRVLPEVMDQNAKASFGVAEASGGLLTAEAVDENRLAGPRTADGWVCGLEEEAGQSVSLFGELINIYPLCHIFISFVKKKVKMP